MPDKDISAHVPYPQPPTSDKEDRFLPNLLQETLQYNTKITNDKSALTRPRPMHIKYLGIIATTTLQSDGWDNTYRIDT